MRSIVIFDPADVRANLLPMTYLRPVGALRIGLRTIREKWESLLPGSYSWQTVDYLRPKFPTEAGATSEADTIYIAGDVLPTPELVSLIAGLEPGTSLTDPRSEVVAHVGRMVMTTVELDEMPVRIASLPDIFLCNGQAIIDDFKSMTAGLDSREPDESVTVIGDPSLLFIHPKAGDVIGCTINTKRGPVYIGPRAEVMEGACLRGPLGLMESSVINMGAKIYGETTIGPFSKVGGELNNVVILGYSNKAHDGFLGNAVIGEWCNLGAGSVASNLKNDYTEIKLWNYPAHRFLKTGLQFCGLIMGDHSKAGINSMLNTATVLGVGVNVHGSGFPRPFLASFTEGSTTGFSDVSMPKFFETARKVMARRGIELTLTDIDILTRVREMAEQYR